MFCLKRNMEMASKILSKFVSDAFVNLYIDQGLVMLQVFEPVPGGTA